MTNRNKPKVKMVAGSVNNMITGFTTASKNPSTIAKIIAV